MANSSRYVESFAPAQSAFRPCRLSRSLFSGSARVKDESLKDIANLRRDGGTKVLWRDRKVDS